MLDHVGPWKLEWLQCVSSYWTAGWGVAAGWKERAEHWTSAAGLANEQRVENVIREAKVGLSWIQPEVLEEDMVNNDMSLI
jgi:hypothetical protein